MHLRHFFHGRLSREESASAFLATLLEYDPDFRLAFFEELFPDAAAALASADWEVTVEAEGVDVRLDSPEGVVLIENKVKAGALRRGQLLRYYRNELSKAPADKPINVAFVVPGGVGGSEINRLTAPQVLRQGDSVASVAWETLVEVAASLPEPEARSWFVNSGFHEVSELMERVAPVDTAHPTRVGLIGIADAACQALRSRSPVRLSRWTGRNAEQIMTNKTNVTLWLDLGFDAAAGEGCHPINVEVGDRLRVSIRTRFKLSAAGRRVPGLKAWWNQKTKEKAFEIPGLGEHELNAEGWFDRCEEVTLPPNELVAAMTHAGEAVLRELSSRLDELGSSLSISEQGAGA